MCEHRIVVTHSGRKTTTSVRSTPQQFDAFQQALLREEFVVICETDHRVELRRKMHVFKDDWPIRLVVEKNNGNLDISYCMFIPWSYIACFGVLVVVFLPLATFGGATLAFFLALGAIGLALFKQQFDFSPNASWQGPPRKRWNEKLNELLCRAFDAKIA